MHNAFYLKPYRKKKKGKAVWVFYLSKSYRIRQYFYFIVLGEDGAYVCVLMEEEEEQVRKNS